MKTCFYAFPSEPVSLTYTISKAIELINTAGYGVHVQAWTELGLGGKIIIEGITDAIDEADVFICDLTFINTNVLFELGYAIATGKRIWITVDKSLFNESVFQKYLYLLTTFNQARYLNAPELVSRFVAEAPFDSLDDTIYNSKIRPILEANSGEPSLLYLKSPIATDTSNELTRSLSRRNPKFNYPVTTDDPEEFSNRPFEWYIESLNSSFAVVAHFMDDKRNTSGAENAKYAFVCGMAFGFAKPVLMVAQTPYLPSIDYRDMVFVHSKPNEIVKFAEAWLEKYKTSLERKKREYQRRQKQARSSQALKRINLGQYVAEDEVRHLNSYFVPTAFYENALNISQYMIYVGRKGSGKTANLYQLAHQLEQNEQKHHVCVIKPPDYELEGVFRLFQLALPKAETSYLIESLWKYLVYTELALSLFDRIDKLPAGMRSADEQLFFDYIRANEDYFIADFTIRLERTIQEVCGVDLGNSSSEVQNKISEILHEQVLSDIRRLLGKLLKDKERVFILVDNLDKAWEKRRDLRQLSEFLFGLLSVAQNIPTEFSKHNSKIDPVNLSLIVFLRSDIFVHIIPKARERDKLKFTWLNWNDSSQLQDIVTRRFETSLENELDESAIWIQFFDPNYSGQPIQAFLTAHIIPRPRDIIFICKQALSHAINHKHTRIEQADIFLALKDYSYHAWLALITESEVEYPAIENVLTEFAGKSEILTKAEVVDILSRSGVKPRNLSRVFDLLCDNNFLGLETSSDNFEYLYEEQRAKVMRKLAQHTAQLRGMERYRINPVFHNHLGIASAVTQVIVN